LTATGQNANYAYASGIVATSANEELEKAGNAGSIEIEARQIVLTNVAQINTLTRGTGQGGTIYLQVSDTLIATGQNTEGHSSGIFAASKNEELEKAGNAGQISIQANQLHLTDGGNITTETNNAGGGDITLTTSNLLYLRNGQVITSVTGGTGNGGNITISKPVFVVLNQGQIKAQADQGKGGNIDITSRQFLKTPSSLVSASSKLGINGTVVIRAPNETVSGSLNLPPDLLDVTNQLPKLCGELTEEEYENLSHFLIHPRAVTGPSPADLSGSAVWFLLPYFHTTTPPSSGKVQKSSREGQAQAGAKPWLVMMECPKMKQSAEKK
jgi:hypothetical protein